MRARVSGGRGGWLPSRMEGGVAVVEWCDVMECGVAWRGAGGRYVTGQAGVAECGGAMARNYCRGSLFLVSLLVFGGVLMNANVG